MFRNAPMKKRIQFNSSARLLEKGDSPGVSSAVSLEDQQKLFQALAAGQLGIWERDLRSGKTICSAGIENVFGIVPQTLEEYLQCLHPDDRVWMADAARQGRSVADYQV